MGHQLLVDEQSTIDGSIKAQYVCLEKGAEVSGIVFTERLNCNSNKNRFRNIPGKFPLDTTVPAFPFTEPGEEDVFVKSSERLRLLPGRYNNVSLEKGSPIHPTSLTLEGGLYQVQDLKVGDFSRLECISSCEIRVQGRLIADQNSYTGYKDGSNLTADDVKIFVGGFDKKNGELFETPESVIFGINSVVIGRLYAPNSTLWLQDGSSARGTFIGREIRLGSRINVHGVKIREAKSDTKITRSLFQRETFDIQTIDGEIRSFRIDPDVKIKSNEIFSRYATDLGLGPRDKMVLRDKLKSETGLVYQKFQQVYKGLPVLGVGYSVTERNGVAISAVGKAARSLDIDTKPILSESEALKYALDAISAEVYDWEVASQKMSTKLPKGKLAIGSVNYTMKPDSFRLIYRFQINSVKPYGSETIDIDAHTGEIIGRFSNIVQSPELSEGDTVHHGHQKFMAESFDDNGKTRYRLRVPGGIDYPSFITKESIIKGSVTFTPPYDDTDFISDENKFNSLPLKSVEFVIPDKSPPLMYGVSIHWGLQKAQDYWKQFNWYGLDAKKQKDVRAILVYGYPCGLINASACYHHGYGHLEFKYGDMSSPTLFVAGHEYTHGVSDNALEIVGDELVYMGERAVLEEGFADLFGRLIYKDDDIPWCAFFRPEHEITYYDGPCPSNLTNLCSGVNCDPVSKVCLIPFGASCGDDMSLPKNYKMPDTYGGLYYMPTIGDCNENNDYCHQNASIVTHWFYLLTIGEKGTNDLNNSYNVVGIGREKAEKIAAHTLLYRLTGTTDFSEMREASIQVAKDLYKNESQVAISVMNAWYAVGVGDKYDPRYYDYPVNVSGVDPWPAHLKWGSLKGEYEWEVQVSPDPLFKNDVKTSKPSESTFIKLPGGLTSLTSLVAKVNLKPLTKYYWRVRSKSKQIETILISDQPQSGSKAGEVIQIPWSPTGSGQVVTNKGPVKVTVAHAPTFPQENGWGDWGLTQAFTTGPKVPQIISPGPKYSSASVDKALNQAYLISTISTLLSSDKSSPAVPIVATGKYYPWSTEFTWESFPGAKEYRLTVSEDPGKKCMPISSGSSGMSLTSLLHTAVRIVPDNAPNGGTVKDEIALKSGNTYYWWLQVTGPEGIAGGCAYGGAPVKFETSIPKTDLLLPPNGGKVSPFAVTLEWKKVEGAVGYELQLAKPKVTGPDVYVSVFEEDEPPFTVLEEVTDNKTTISVTQLGKYYWRVIPKGPKIGNPPLNDKGAVSETRYFVTDLDLTKPELIFPEPGYYLPYGDTAKFGWFPVVGAEKYNLVIYNRNTNGTVGNVVSQIDSGFESCTHPSYSGTSVCVNVPGVSSHTEGYCWKVTAIGPGGLKGVDSDVSCYNVGAAYVELLSPEDGATGVEYGQTMFSWSSKYAPVGYKLWYLKYVNACGIGNAEKIIDILPNTTNKNILLLPDTKYCWGVNNLNPDGSVRYSGMRYFRTKKKPKPVETCKTLYDQNNNNPSIDITSPPQLGDTTKPIYVFWNVYDAGIKEYQIKISSFNPYGQPIEVPLYTSETIPAATMTSGNTATYMFPLWVQNLNYKFYKVYVSARTGSSCSWTLLDLVTFGVD
jgi:Zn-dependent metalloprotease